MGAAEPLRLVFMGTPDLAAAVLDRVLGWAGGVVAAVYCQPDRPAGRGMALKAPPVKELALLREIPVLQPRAFKDDETVAILRSFRPDYLLVAAYGLILPQRVLDVPSRMALNVHTSLLPQYRGAAPIQRAIMDGRAGTGVTIMKMEAGLDTGPVVLQEAVPIGPDETAEELHDVLAGIGGELLVTALEGLESGKLTCIPQDDANASYAAKLEKSDGYLDFSRTGKAIHARRRGVTPWPGAFATLQWEAGGSLDVKILDGRFHGGPPPGGKEQPPAGTIFPALVDNALAVSCADGVYLISRLRPAGRKLMDAAAFMNGYLKGRGSARFALPPG